MKQVIITGDDFGLSRAVNDGIEEAHRDGILTAASLMVGAPAAADAVARAHRLPSLAIGLHVVVSRGRAVLPAEQLSSVADAAGELPHHLVAVGVRYAFVPRARRQLANEIRAQFEAFQATGLVLDHVNAHNHMHLHPAVLELILGIGKEFGLRAVRVPREPLPPASLAGVGRVLGHACLAPWHARLRRRLVAAGVRSNDFFFGFHDSGQMTTERVAGFLRGLPEGVTELGFHPARGQVVLADPAAEGYQFQAELEALTSAAVKDALAESGARPCGFRDLILSAA